MPAEDALNHIVGQKADGITQPVNDLMQSFEYFVSESHRAKLLPDLLYGAQFRGIRRDSLQGDIIRHFGPFDLCHEAPSHTRMM